MKTNNLYKTLVGLGLATTLVANTPKDSSAQEIPYQRKIEINSDDNKVKIESVFPLLQISKYENTDFRTNYLLNPEKNHLYIIPNDSIKGDLEKYINQVKDCPECFEENKEGKLEKFTKEDKSTKIQRGILLTNNFTESEDSITIGYNLNKYIKDAISNSKSPAFLLEGTNGTISINDDTTKFYITAPKSDLGKKIAIGVIDKQGKIPGLGDKNKPLASFYGYLNYFGKGEEVQDSTQTKVPSLKEKITGEGKEGDLIFIDNSKNTIINNYYPQVQDSAKVDTTKKERAFRVLTEAGYGTGTHLTARVSPQWQISKNLFVGPYVEGNLFKENKTVVTPIDKTDAIVPNLLYSRTQGTITDNSNIQKPFGYGLMFSANTTNEKLMFNLGAGMLNMKSSQGKRIHEGIDQILQNDQVIETKDYFYESGEPIKESESVPIINASMNFFPFKGKAKNAYFGVEGQQSLKSKSDKFKHSSVNAKVGWKF